MPAMALSGSAYLTGGLSNHAGGKLRNVLHYSGQGLPSADAAIASAAAAAAQESDPDERLIGTHLGPYKVEAIAGHGGMGAVYRASRDDAEFRQQVAIKLVRVAAESPDTMRRFRQERQILARLSHPNIARLRRRLHASSGARVRSVRKEADRGESGFPIGGSRLSPANTSPVQVIFFRGFRPGIQGNM
jgi:hypothetical protein